MYHLVRPVRSLGSVLQGFPCDPQAAPGAEQACAPPFYCCDLTEYGQPPTCLLADDCATVAAKLGCEKEGGKVVNGVCQFGDQPPPVPPPPPIPTPAQQCNAEGGFWVDGQCQMPDKPPPEPMPTPAELCNAGGGFWVNGECQMPPPPPTPEEQCKVAGGSWANGKCTMPLPPPEKKGWWAQRSGPEKAVVVAFGLGFVGIVAWNMQPRGRRR